MENAREAKFCQTLKSRNKSAFSVNFLTERQHPLLFSFHFRVILDVGKPNNAARS